MGEKIRFSSYPGDLDTLPAEMFESFKPVTRKEIDLLPVENALAILKKSNVVLPEMR
ncbi:hypothetical protein [Candidatus Kuenenia stuttgartiensis]|uniref:hypothetical protein n=1 Tax=Kuenenia stuttgartiensis TaxID=174633 RepID=UPI00146DB910|nr:hypothetical protein [Candidatus Kuenenia stuttgartiensis]